MRIPAVLWPCALLMLLGGTVDAGQVGYGADVLRSGWYRDQPGLSPEVVSSGDFGQRFSTPVQGQVYAQPLLYGGTLFIATQANWIYGLDPVSGAIRWSRSVGTPWNSSDLGCTDIWPLVGVTSTPVIDDVSGIAYFMSKSYDNASAAVWNMHAVAVATGAEQPGFPVAIQGSADNNHQAIFSAATQFQRPGLLLMDGVVYAAFGSVCDIIPFQGWVVGVSTAGAITCMWVDHSGTGSGGGIWMSGSGLVSDAPGQIVFATGNGYSAGTPTIPGPGDSPPADLGESVVRLTVRPNGTLQATGYFTPFNANTLLDPDDGDLGSGGVIGLPYPYFGSDGYRDVLVQAGKEGVVCLHDGTALGGYQQGTGGGDLVIQKIGPYGGVWSKPSVWGGDGGWIYLPTASPSFSPGPSSGYLRAYQAGVDGSGKPTLALAGSATDVFAFASSPPIVTSSGSTSGSALVWIVWNPDFTGVGAELRAYDVLPVSGILNLRFSAPVGQGSKYNPPGVGQNHLYVGTRDGHVIGFGPATLDAEALVSTRTLLSAPRPNPLRSTATMDLTLEKSGIATIAIYDLSGRRMRRLLDGAVAAGSRQVVWDGRDEAGAPVPAGLYLVRLDALGAQHTRRVLVIR